MRKQFLAVLVGCSLALPLAAAEPANKATARRTVIPFDFESKFDDGEYGRTIGDMIWKKLERRGGFVIPESMMDVRDWSKQSGVVPGPGTSLEKIKTYVRKDQGGDIGIWGKVERVSGSDTDVYDLWIYVADFSATPVKMIYQTKVRTKTVSEIPHTYIQAALDKLYGRSAAPVEIVADATAEERWKKGPNLIQGDLQKGRGHPAGWDPLPKFVTWVKGKKNVLRFTLNEDVAGSTGVLYYSDYFPVEKGATYRFQCRWHSTGSAAKVFIKCYDELPTGFRGGSGNARTEKREVYRSQQNLKGPARTWNVQTEDFTPDHRRFTPRYGRVMLYAYWPAGTVEWGDIVVKQIKPAPKEK